MSVQQVKHETSASELAVWVEYLKREQRTKLTREKLDYYLAQVACETRRSYVKEPSKVKLKDFLLDFEPKQQKKLTREERTKVAKNFWFSALGLDQSGKQVQAGE